MNDCSKIKKQLDKVQKENISKSYFIAQASHDLRQPLQAMKIFINALKKEKLNKKQQDIVSHISKSASSLKHLLDNLLDVSKLESGGFEKQEEKFNIGDILRDIYEETKPLAEEKGIKLKITTTELLIRSDRILIERIVRNLLSNALKYTKDKVIINCKYINKHIRIIIMDNGCGISEQELPHIFDEFFQSKSIKNNRQMGSGLGLAIVHKLALIIKGRIHVKSRIKKGSCFILSFPVKI